MPRANINPRPDRKLTDFFSKRPKTGPRPGQVIYDVSSSSERQSIISISSDEIPIPVSMSNSVQSMHVRDGTTRARPLGGPYSKVQSSSSRRSETRLVPNSPSGSVILSTKNSPTPSGISSQSPTTVSSMPRKNGKKRKQQPINLISSEESDGPVFPSIHVKLSSKKNERESKSNPQHLALDQPPCISPVIPLTPRQNTLSTPTCFPPESDVVLLPITPIIKPAVQQIKNGISAIPTPNRPSPPKRARYNSASSEKLKPFALGCDADDESEDEDEAFPESFDRKTSRSAHFAQHLEMDGVIIIDDDMHMNVDSGMPPSSPASTRGIKEGGAKEVRGKESDHGNKPLARSFGSNGHSRKDIQEVLPSSQHGETELLMDSSHMYVDKGDNSGHSFLPVIPVVSPSKARTDNIIARIKAKAEADAAAQVEDDRKRLSLGLLGSDISDLSSLSSISTNEDESELELELNMFREVNSVIHTDPSITSVHVRSATPPNIGTRRSTRHVDLPAPNYAKKLELFRDFTPPPFGKGRYDADRKVKCNGKVVETCPLDILLKDSEREGARKARVETKRKGTILNSLGSNSALERASSVLQTPKLRRAEAENPGHDLSSQDYNVFRDVSMGAATREELLGKEEAKAVGKILDSDRRKKNVIEDKENGVSFWRETNPESDIDVVPQLVITDQSSPFLTALKDVLNRKDYAVASLLVDSGVLASVPLSVQLLNWLFATAMSAANHDISRSAYQALIILHREVCSTDVTAYAQLISMKLLIPLFKLGVNTQVAELFGVDGEDMVSFVGLSPELKAEKLCRYMSMVEALGRCQRIDPMAIPHIVSALLLLSLDRSALPELPQDAVSAIEVLLASPNVTRIVELDTCRFVLHVMKSLSFTYDLQVRLLALLPGCSHSSGRVRRWIAWAMLGGDLQCIQVCADVPPIQLMIDLFSKTSPGVVKLEVTPHTDYEQLGAMVGILSVVMTDVDAYVRLANGGALTKRLYEALEQLNGKIVDTRAVHMDRTKTKEAINRLHKRLVYQRHAALEMLRTKTGKMDQFLVAKPKLSAKPTSGENHIKDT